MVDFVKRLRARLAQRREERSATAGERAQRRADAEARRLEHRRQAGGSAGEGGGGV